MSGVGSTNAMKKGSANNPFLAFSEADMKGYLNSAYTGCIVKYNGDPIARKISDINKTVPDNAQNLVFNRSKGSPASNWGCFKITTKSGDTETVQYLRTLFYNYRTKEVTWETQHSSGWVVFLAICNNQHPTNVVDLLGIKILWVPGSYESNSDDYPAYWPVTLGWQGENVDADGKVTLWGYGENVSFVYLEDGKDIYITYNDIPCVITPYEVGELYKVVYVDNEYRYEEFHYISEDKTTAGAEDVAPGKTFYDFAGTKQIGTGTRANPFLARGDSDMNAFNNATYLGKFVKYIGKTNDTYVKDAIYQVTNDATEYDRYMLLPTLENEGKASDLAQGKQLINSKGEIVEGDAPAQGDILAKYASKQLTEFVTDEEIPMIGSNTSYGYFSGIFTMYNQSNLSKFDCKNVKVLAGNAFVGCKNLKSFNINIDVQMSNTSNKSVFSVFDEEMIINADSIYHKLSFVSTVSNSKAFLLRNAGYSNSISGVEAICPGAHLNVGFSMLSFNDVKRVNTLAISSCSYLETIYLPNCEYIDVSAIYHCSRLKKIECPNLKFLSAYAIDYCNSISEIDVSNVQFVGNRAFGSASLLTVLEWPKVKTFIEPYASNAILSGTVSLPVAETVSIWQSSVISSIYCPNVLSLNIANNNKITDLYLSKCKHANLKMTALTTLSLPECETISTLEANKLSSISLPNLRFLNQAYINSLESLYFPNLEGCVSGIYDPKVYIRGSKLSYINLPKLASRLTLNQCLQLNELNIPLCKALYMSSCTLGSINSPNCTTYSLYLVQALSTFTINLSASLTYVDIRFSGEALANVTITGDTLSKDVTLKIYNANTITLDRHISSPVIAYSVSFDCKKAIITSKGDITPSMFWAAHNLSDVDVKYVDTVCSGAFEGCSNLTDIYLPACRRLSSYAFSGCNKLSALILKNTSVVSIYNTTVLSNTPIVNSSYTGQYGSVYVPASLVASYKRSTTWSYFSSRITSITDLPQELKDKYGLNGVE